MSMDPGTGGCVPGGSGPNVSVPTYGGAGKYRRWLRKKKKRKLAALKVDVNQALSGGPKPARGKSTYARALAERYASAWSGPTRGARGGTYWVNQRSGEKTYEDPTTGKAKAKQSAKAVGKAVGHAEHKISSVAAAALGKLPKPIQQIIGLSWKATMAGYNAGRTAAEKSAVAAGASPEKAAQIGKTLGMIDLMLSKGVFAGTLAAGASAGVASAAAFIVPAASVGYLAFSTAKNPQATLELARKAVRKVLDLTNRGPSKYEREAHVYMGKSGEAAAGSADHDKWLACFAASMDLTKGDWSDAISMASKAAEVMAGGPETYARRLIETYAFKFRGPRSGQDRIVSTRSDIPKSVQKSGAYQQIDTDKEKASKDSHVYKGVKRRHSRIQTHEDAQKLHERLQTLDINHLRVLGWHHDIKGRSRAGLMDKLRALALLKATEKAAKKGKPLEEEKPQAVETKPPEAEAAKVPEPPPVDPKAEAKAKAAAKRAEASATRKAMNANRLKSLEALKAKMKAAKAKISIATTPQAAERAEKAADKVAGTLAQKLAEHVAAKNAVVPSKLPGLQSAVASAQRPGAPQATAGTVKDALKAIVERRKAAPVVTPPTPRGPTSHSPHTPINQRQSLDKPAHEHTLEEFGVPYQDFGSKGFTVRGGPARAMLHKQYGDKKTFPTRDAAEKWLAKTHERVVKEGKKQVAGSVAATQQTQQVQTQQTQQNTPKTTDTPEKSVAAPVADPPRTSGPIATSTKLNGELREVQRPVTIDVNGRQHQAVKHDTYRGHKIAKYANDMHAIIDANGKQLPGFVKSPTHAAFAIDRVIAKGANQPAPSLTPPRSKLDALKAIINAERLKSPKTTAAFVPPPKRPVTQPAKAARPTVPPTPTPMRPSPVDDQFGRDAAAPDVGYQAALKKHFGDRIVSTDGDRLTVKTKYGGPLADWIKKNKVGVWDRTKGAWSVHGNAEQALVRFLRANPEAYGRTSNRPKRPRTYAECLRGMCR